MNADKLGALWLKKANNGSSFLSGEITINEQKIKIVVFKNKKEKENQPDYNILISRPKTTEQQVTEAGF